MELLDAHQRAMAEFDRVVHHVRDDQWDGPTPCTEWSVRAVVNHLVFEQLWVPHLLRGETLTEVGDRYEGEVLGADPIRAWERAALDARTAVAAPGALAHRVHLSYGDDSAVSYGWQLTSDLAVHSWDLATAIGIRSALDDELATTIYHWCEPTLDQWQGLGIFAPTVPVPADASPTDRLVTCLAANPDPEMCARRTLDKSKALAAGTDRVEHCSCVIESGSRMSAAVGNAVASSTVRRARPASACARSPL